MLLTRSRFSVALTLGVAVLAMLPFAVSAESLRFGGSSGGIGTLEFLAAHFRKQQPKFEHRVVPDLSSGGGIKAVSAGLIDVAISSRALRAEEQGAASASRLGSTPFVFTTAVAIPISETTTAELAAIYSGRQTTWRDGRRLRLALAPADDIDNQLIASLGPAMAEAIAQAHRRPGMIVEPTDHLQANALQRIADAMGALPLALIRTERRPLKALTLDGVTASRATLASGRYPLAKDVWLVTAAKPAETTRKFVDFVRSERGRKLLHELGFHTE